MYRNEPIRAIRAAKVRQFIETATILARKMHPNTEILCIFNKS